MIACVAFERDPVSLLFDRGARQLLDRAYSHPGRWQRTRIAGPSPGQVAYFASLGINVLGRDDLGRDRWAAGFVRALYHQHLWFRTGRGWGARRMTPNDGRAVRYELGRMKPALGIIPAGRAVRIVSKPGGAAAYRAVQKLPAADRIFDGDQQGPRAVDSTGRDWLKSAVSIASPPQRGARLYRDTHVTGPAGPMTHTTSRARCCPR